MDIILYDYNQSQDDTTRLNYYGKSNVQSAVCHVNPLEIIFQCLHFSKLKVHVNPN